MLKKIWSALGIVLVLATFGFADQRTYGDYLVNDPTLAYSSDYDLNLDMIDYLAMQAIYSTATISQLTFDDGVASTASITISSNSALSGSRFSINGRVFDEGVKWTKQSTASGTAKSVSDSIVADPVIGALIVSTWTSGGIVRATATAAGSAYNYTLFSSTPAGLTVTNFSNGQDSDITVASDNIYISQHGMTTGFPMRIETVAGTIPSGLTASTTYYAIRVDDNNIKLSSSSVLARAGTAVNITGQTSQGGGSFTLTQMPFSGNFSFKWQSSNDGTNFFDLPISSVTYSAAANTMWDGPIYYRYLRFHFVVGDSGGLNLKVKGNGKRRPQ